MSEELPKENDLYIQELPAVAKTIYLPCKKCEVDRFFTVLAHKSEKSAKLECEACKAKKSFTIRKPKKIPTGRKRTVRKKVTIEEQWQQLNQKIGSSDAKKYNMKDNFDVNSAIDHGKFGLGFVTDSSAQKIEVLFQEFEKSLVHNR
ncbi:MAG: hypothetical protein HOO06_12090 [Bdellovibrionaceae bacterium]|nr:hypothetical protein [Pseudobdellovibrionaceae bacterium]